MCILKFMLFYCVICIFFSCSSFHKEQLENALSFATFNRLELEKVLKHYEHDSLKLEAAKFLIRNMPHCYSYQQGGEMDSVKRVRTYYSPFGQIDQTYARRWGHYTYRNLLKIYDAHIITAEYLIDNIDRAFDNWQKRPWNRSLSFEDFCEYLLPYRIGDEPLEEWRELYEKKYGYLLDSIYKGSDVVEAANLVSRHLQEPVFIYCEDFELPHIGPRYLFSHRYGSCVDAADIVTYAFRAVGIPCMEDTDARGGHVWNVVRDTTGRDVPIWYIASEAVRGSRDTGGYKRGKVYRPMYGFQEEKAAHLGDDWKSMPLLFYHPYMKDVSYAYYPDTLRILTGIPDGEVCYLAHFHEAHWWSCACARSASGKMEIPNLESELVYLPMKYTKGNYYPSGFPFWFAGGEINTFLPDWEKTVKVRLYRKYPVYGWLRSFMGHVVGGTFEGSMTKDFEDGKTLYEIADTPVIARNRIFLNKPVKCRYIRYKADNDKCAELAEMTFYANGKAVSPIAVWGSPTEKGNMHVLAKHVADGNPLSYYLSLDKGGEVVVDLGRVAVIDCLEYMPRNDDNFISPGDTYELFCHAGTEGWKSLGKQRADTTCLDWIVPDNALFWLRDLTRGREEHIFFMQNGRQKFPTF